MNYLTLNTIFLGLAVLAAAAALWRRPASRLLYAASGLALVAVLVLTAVFDNIMIGVGLVAYDPALISGVFVGIAPVEDFAYPVAAALLLPAVWSLLGGDTRPPIRRRTTPRSEQDE
ncbi:MULTISPECIES: lycopene cyclase domain-containing protein [unclassified Cryobacterium]|uniref:lycopene cyclase domain-containing protein n=1 Tax=unclassified Cryobacterium TaxID=2649013 RepID=UPI0010692394|nr:MULTISPECIES: lycopene cyclase domain-containing protein [unclassified Cryobacterium]TFC53465.1 lycopene cyclase domain-containing protein [Cryobacterium sp. TMB3-1-2]TFC69131.1 lycopene cyclase domain-containing protein [Cryobacterium sp. TMB3-15]TFC76070.1 lycopene cyclase domain-containing protein [Cryobacterium sp. TMB3-10]TFD43924.1 lycopene cyclase domain-containing protein [Cryobacterium sp. TMB3-12]